MRHRVRVICGFVFLAGLWFSASVFTALAGETDTPKPAVVVYFSNPKSETMWPALAEAFPQEAAQAAAAMPAGLQLMDASLLGPHAEFGRLVQVHLLGRCDVAEQAFRPLARGLFGGPLGWVLRVDGEIQPYVYVDCERLSQYLDAKVLGMSAEQRQQAMVTAIARIMVHEWLHITLQTADHTEHGIRQAELTVDELVLPRAASGD